MNFNSLEFALFFLTVYALYLSLGHKAQNRMLLAASYLFYSFWDWRFLGLILLSTVTDFICADRIAANRETPALRKLFLGVSIGVNLGVLFFFKYFNFFLDNLFALISLFGPAPLHIMDAPHWRIILPVGISFYTFQTMSYTIDVYRGEVEPASDFADYALYVSFFPQLVAGPIERAKSLLPQIANPRQLTPEHLTEGAFLIYWGLFKKVFIADNLGDVVHYINTGLLIDGGMVLISTYAFLFQLYCDFSAYSDIARGTARMMGFEIMVNFRAPLFAPNIQETWNRWHISLTSWIRDYLYYPLALMRFNRCGRYGICGAGHIPVRLVVIITFLIMGLWHGAAWNYVLWGGYNGLLLSAYSMITPKLRGFRKRIAQNAVAERLWFGVAVLTTFHFALFGTLLFQADSLSQIVNRLALLFGRFAVTPRMVEMGRIILFYISPLLIVDAILFRKERITHLFDYPPAVRYGFLYITLYLMVVHRPLMSTFIYFQF